MGVGKGNKRVVVKKKDEYVYHPILPAGKDEYGRPNYIHDPDSKITVPTGLTEYGQKHLKKETKRKYVIGVPKEEYRSDDPKTKLVDAPTVHYSQEKDWPHDEKLDPQGKLIQGPQESAWAYKKEKTKNRRQLGGFIAGTLAAVDHVASAGKDRNWKHDVADAVKKGVGNFIRRWR